MPVFTDTRGDRWEVTVTVATIKRLRSLLGIDLLDTQDLPVKVSEILVDPVLLADVLYVVCKTEADKRGISDEEFGARLAGEIIVEARDAFLEALIDFFPQPETREYVATVVNSLRRMMKEISDATMKALQSPKVIEELKKIETLYAPRFTNAPEFSESIQTTGLSEN